MAAHLFEGPEKKVELVVGEDHTSLRVGGEARWAPVVEAARATILSRRSTGVFDAYLLSESSLFVYDEHVTMITCGQTRLVDAVEAMLEFVPAEAVVFLAYERKNEHFPWKQATTFDEDARRLAERFPGRALRFGDEHSHSIHLFHTTRPYAPDPDDTTLEVLMHGIGACAPAFQGEGPDARDRARSTGVAEVLGDFAIDDHVFSPAGYSLNGLQDGLYYTFHVTPEEVGSYVSFETNFDFRTDPDALVRRVVELFQPESFDVLAFLPDREFVALEVPGYRQRKEVRGEVCGYGVGFHHFFRPPSGPISPVPIPL